MLSLYNVIMQPKIDNNFLPMLNREKKRLKIAVKIVFLILFTLLYAEAKTFPVCKEYYYVNENKTKEKSTFLEKILKEDPKNVECMLKLSSLYLRTNRVSQAFDLIRRAYILNPEYVEKQNISKVLDLALRLSRLNEMAHKNQDYELYNELGDTYYEVGIFDEAAKAYEKSLKLNTPQTEVEIALALTYMNLGENVKSEQVLRALTIREPYNFYANYYLGKLLKNLRNKEKEGLVYLRMASYIISHTDVHYKKKGEKKILQKDLRDELHGEK